MNSSSMLELKNFCKYICIVQTSINSYIKTLYDNVIKPTWHYLYMSVQ